MRRKIAPLLTAMVHEYAQHRELDLHGKTWPDAERELRALLAVVREAERVADLAAACSQNGGQVCGAEWMLIAKVGRLRRLSSRPQRAGRGR